MLMHAMLSKRQSGRSLSSWTVCREKTEQLKNGPKSCFPSTRKKAWFEKKVRNDAGAIQESGERTRWDGQAQGQGNY